MAQATVAMPLNPVPVLDAERVLARLPAGSRAQLAWTRVPIADGLSRLGTEKLTDDVVGEVTAQVWNPLRSIGVAFSLAMTSRRDEMRAELMGDLERNRVLLSDLLADPDATDTLEWVAGSVRSVFDAFLVQADPDWLARFAENAPSGTTTDPDLDAFRRGFVALVAATEIARTSRDAKRAVDLVDIAFLELAKFRKSARRLGTWISPFPYETDDERRRQLARYAGVLRATLTDDDWRAVEQSRLYNLR